MTTSVIIVNGQVVVTFAYLKKSKKILFGLYDFLYTLIVGCYYDNPLLNTKNCDVCFEKRHKTLNRNWLYIFFCNVAPPFCQFFMVTLERTGSSGRNSPQQDTLVLH